MPEDWFTASDVHLSGNPREVDLVVMGDHIARGPNSSAFWVLRQSSGGYKLVFRTDAHDLMLLKTKTNELRDIRTAFSSLLYNSTAEFRFTGNVYQVAKRTLQPNGYKAHRDMSQYEFRKTLVQLTGQDPTPILAEARAWLWQHWQAHKRSYLRVSTHDDDGERQDCSYFFDDESEVGQWQVTIEAHRVVSHKDSPSGPPYLVAEDEILIASQVQRTEPKVDDSHMPRILHDVEELPATAYRLRFIDYRNISLDTL
ncbi:MAG: hypothetical protein ACRD50_07335 [Candidatus Acidiferrales bacterium]